MAQNQFQKQRLSSWERIHPYDLEKTANERCMRPSAPLIPSVKNQAVHRPAPPIPSVKNQAVRPVVPSKTPKRSGFHFCRCFCCVFILFLLLLGACAGILYAVLKPKLPQYSVDKLRVKSFNVNADLSITSQLSVRVTATNPNEKIGIYYLPDNSLTVSYQGVSLCSGELPAFYQGHDNTTRVEVLLNGNAVKLASGTVNALSAQGQQGNVPLRLSANVPVKIKVGSIKSMRIKCRIKCDLAVKGLKAGEDIAVSTDNCRARVRL